MRFFQPLSQYGLARMLAETRTRTHLSPGILGIEKPELMDGYSAFFDINLPSSYLNLNDPFKLIWRIAEQKKDKALSTEFNIPFQPFYPPSIDVELSGHDFELYTDKFLSLEEIYKQVFMLPINSIETSSFDSVLETDVSLIALIGVNRIFNNQRKLSETIVSLKDKLPPDIGIYLPGPVSPAYFSFLVYMGVDFFDNSLAYQISKNGYFVMEDNLFSVNHHPKCFCQYCSQDPNNLLGHNEQIMKNEIFKVRFALEEGNLRELVEKDIHRSVTFAATLKHFDKNFSKIFSQRMPIISSSKLKCIGEESLHHPSILEFRERVRTRFQPLIENKIILLLPCSARKPYSFSRSHIQFRNAIKRAGKRIFATISEVIVTSPLSVVPRELESIYPAKFYDIPVSGVWSEEEISLTADLLFSIVNQYPKDTIIINHMYGHGYQHIIDILKEKLSVKIIDTSLENSPSSHDSLNYLTQTLNELCEGMDLGSYSLPLKIKTLQATADYQFGKGTGEILFSKNDRIRGKYPKDQQIFREKQHIATLSSRTGFLSLSPDIAQEIIGKSMNKLEFGAEYISGSNIYAPGLISADDTIHPDDEIFIINDNRVIGTARALVSGGDMNKMTSGSIAEVKKKLKVKK
ncbi:hypothetical protein EU534_02700 [Candidatus Heimdallarchaeota archaeon]|nr:MAG: hypothetical protein EU534_02700 [Candidatus Heimdallarchaeota archaeon]